MIRRPRRTVLAALALVGLAGLAAACGTKGSGNRITESRAVSAFDEVHVEGVTNLDLGVGAPSVILEGDDNILPKLETTVVGSRLTIAAKGSILMTGGKLAAHVTTPTVKKVTAEGSGDVKIDGAAGKRLELEISGSRKAVVVGNVDELVLRVSGACEIDATKLVAKAVEIDASGSSEVELGVPTTLNVRGTGASRVRYAGTPTVTRDVGGSASVEAR